jgi:hypothetical protein
VRHEKLSFKTTWFLRSVQHERFGNIELILRLFVNMEEEGRGRGHRLDLKVVLVVNDSSCLCHFKSWLEGEPGEICGFREKHLAASKLLGHDLHVECKILATEDMPELYGLSICDLVSDLQALFIVVVLVRFLFQSLAHFNVLFKDTHFLLQVGQLLLVIQCILITCEVCNDLVYLVFDLVSCFLKLTNMVVYLAVLLYFYPEKALFEEVGGIMG